MMIAGQLTDLDWCRIQDVLSYKIEDNEGMMPSDREIADDPDLEEWKEELEEDIVHYNRIYEAISEFQAQAKRGTDES